MQLFYLRRQYYTATTAEYFYMPAAAFFQQVVHVFKILCMTTLVRGNGNGIGVFLNGTVYDLLYAAVVAQVNYLGAAGLHYAPHDIYRGVVAIEKRGGRNNSYLIL